MVDDEVLADLKTLGATDEQLTQLRDGKAKAAVVEDSEHFEVLPENWRPVQLFLSSTSQWRKTVISTMSKAQVRIDGFDYASIEAVMRIHGIARKDRAEVFAELRVMEMAAVDELNARA